MPARHWLALLVVRTVTARTVPMLVLATAALGLFAAPPARAEDHGRADSIRARYAKYEYRIPMRDGTHLFTAVYVPNGASRRQTYPILMTRTPYSVAPYGADRYRTTLGPAAAFEREGFIFVWQDVRGRYLSEGQFVDVRPHVPRKRGKSTDESSDTYDTIAWLLENVPYHNGKVGLWGLSYGGFYAAAGAIDSHPALVAVSPQAPIADWFWDDMHRHGAFNLALTFLFFSGFGVPRESLSVESPKRFDMQTPDSYQFFLDLGPLANADARHFHGKIPFWNDLVAHPNYDTFWQARNLLPHLDHIKSAVLTVGGWFDTEDLYGPLQTYAAVERQNPGIRNTLIMGPWSHGQWIRGKGDTLGSADFGTATSDWYQEHVALPFFLQHLKGAADADLPEALVFETGANRWRRFDSWPPAATTSRRLYFQPGGKLDWQAPAGAEDGGDTYISDPMKPVPYTADIASSWSATYMTEDQRFAARRPDVLVYRTEPLAADVTLAGPLQAELFVSTTGTDADFVVKLIDEYPGTLPALTEAEKKAYPGGRQMLVRGEPFRARFRDSYETPKPFTPGEPTRVAFRINDVMHTFKRGHRIMLQVQSTWFPFIDRNPQTFVPSIFAATAADFVVATHRLHRSQAHPSRLEVRVLQEPPGATAP